MFIDGRTLPDKSQIEADLAIIGAGAAGITLARALKNTGLKIALVESGGLAFEDATQELYQGETSGTPYNLDTARLRYFGGSTNHWGGWCRPLEALDFEPRDWVPHSGWPIKRTDLDPYYVTAQEICQLGPLSYDDPKTWSGDGTMAPMALPGGDVETRFFQFSPPTRFGEVYRDDIATADTIDTFLHTNLKEIEATDSGADVTGLALQTLAGNRFTLRAKKYVLAAGGIENARLLLLSNSVKPAGLGNDHDLVGRFFMDHPIVPLVGQLVAAPASAVARYYHGYTKIDGTVVRGCLMFSPAYLQRTKALSTIVTFSPQSEIGQDPATGPDPNAAPLERELVSLLQTNEPNPTGTRYVMGCGTEQVPNPDSRVTLSDEKDALGQNRTKLAWRLTAQDRSSLRQNLETLAHAFGAWGPARMRINFTDTGSWDEVSTWSHHHIGTTRMAQSDRQGVVDAEGKVHNMSNLYVAGSSIFPTAGGASNPTLTIIALTLRLADHLRDAFANPEPVRAVP